MVNGRNLKMRSIQKLSEGGDQMGSIPTSVSVNSGAILEKDHLTASMEIRTLAKRQT